MNEHILEAAESTTVVHRGVAEVVDTIDSPAEVVVDTVAAVVEWNSPAVRIHLVVVGMEMLDVAAVVVAEAHTVMLDVHTEVASILVVDFDLVLVVYWAHHIQVAMRLRPEVEKGKVVAGEHQVEVRPAALQSRRFVKRIYSF